MKLALTGGFLGSGKTTAIVKACQHLMQQHKKVTVITNDQGDQQVDSALVKSFGIPSGEVSNGCFCCNYSQLDEQISSLRSNITPDIIFAESVGSCTDIIATVAKPLNAITPDIDIVVSIFADAELLLSLLENRSSFIEESVRYIYKKQLDEADLLIINKTDLLTEAQLNRVKQTIKTEYPAKTILCQSSWNDQDILRWLRMMDEFIAHEKRRSLEIDYDVYAEGEARLAWLDKSIQISSKNNNAVFITGKVIGSVFNYLQEHRLTIGHLKFFIETENGTEKISFTTTSTGADVRLKIRETNAVKLLINARVQSQPELLATLVENVLSDSEKTYGCRIQTEKSAVFKPGYPKPVHRVLND